MSEGSPDINDVDVNSRRPQLMVSGAGGATNICWDACDAAYKYDNVDLRDTTYVPVENPSKSNLALIKEIPEDNTTLVAFRGTHAKSKDDFVKWMNILQDADIRQEQLDTSCIDGASAPSNALVHSGFQGALKELTEAGLFDKVTGKDKSILITGHSLGGAMALLFAIQLILMGYKNVQLITFGQPRVGNEDFNFFVKTLISERSLKIDRYWHWLDPVPNLPPEKIEIDALGINVEIGFVHVEDGIQLSAPLCIDAFSLMNEMLNHAGEDLSLKDRSAKMAEDLIENHKLDSYKEYLIMHNTPKLKAKVAGAIVEDAVNSLLDLWV